MASTTSQGNYYKRRTKEYYEDLGYFVAYTETLQSMFIKGVMRYRKRDLVGADGIAMNGEEIIFWNSKSTVAGHVSWLKSTGSSEFRKFPFPKCVKLQLVIWEPKKKPVIIDVEH
jgi:hypothetical protein